jgi:uncharacterized oxidoreductase
MHAMTLIPHNVLRDFAAAVFAAAGCSAYESRIVADHLVDANLLGHDSHGVIRVPVYCDWLEQGKVVANRRAECKTDLGAVLVFDGQFGFGQVIGADAMAAAAERATSAGLALVAIRNSGHLGRIGAYAEFLAKAGLVSLHFVNSSGGGIMVTPHGGGERRFSANPIAAGAPGPHGRVFVLDLATAIIAEGSIMLAIDRGESLPPGSIIDGSGRPTINPADFYGPPPGAILPFGGHKGSGLSFFCEILAGSLTGGKSGYPGNETAGRFVNNMLSLVISPAALGDMSDYAADVDRLVDWIKSARPAVEGQPVLLPGENGERTRREREKHGIPIDGVTRDRLTMIAERLGVAVPFAQAG